MAHFKIRGYKDGKLWAEFEEGAYSETQPGQEQEAILKLHDYRSPGKFFDLTDCRVEVSFLFGYILSEERANPEGCIAAERAAETLRNGDGRTGARSQQIRP